LKVACLYPCVGALVEKLATIFPGLTVIGPPCDDLNKWPKEILPLAKAIDRVKEWQEVGLDIHFEEKPYSECDFSKFDLLIESVETFNYSADWKNHCHRVESPTIVFVCWFDNPSYLPENYRQKIKNLPILLGMPSALPAWQSEYPQAKVAPVPVGNWWFEREWTGIREEALFVLAGKDLWRPGDKSICGVDLFEKLCERFPGRMHHHDGALEFRTSKEMAEMFSQYRVFVNLDGPGGRPLCTSFTEALAAGMPVIARDLPGLSYKDYIDGNGIYTDNLEAMCSFLHACFVDTTFARVCGQRSRDIARKHFSVEAVRPYYEVMNHGQG
jgi:glycosyltransferase involved in cell wall biosynthesis